MSPEEIASDVLRSCAEVRRLPSPKGFALSADELTLCYNVERLEALARAVYVRHTPRLSKRLVGQPRKAK